MSGEGDKVAIDALQVGMFVHLDLGWWAHPFALSSFLITEQAQIDTIRALGLARVRWSPERSRLAPPPVAPAALAQSAAAAPVVAPMAPAAAPAPREAAEDPRQDARCRAQLVEAHLGWQQAWNCLPHEPRRAAEISARLAGALADKMLGDGELAVRALSCEGTDPVASHAMNVAVISMLLARLSGLAADEIRELGCGAMLHDVGKLMLPVGAQYDDDRAAPADRERWRQHVDHGLAFGRKMGLSPTAMSVIAQHHEHADGSGFPNRERLDGIATAARIVAIVDAYDRLCNPRQPGAARTPHEALSLLFTSQRSRFDAPLLHAFIRMMGVYPPGSLVQLTDERFASVIGVNSTRPLKPRVLVCDRAGGADPHVLDLDGQPALGIRRSVSAAQLPDKVRQGLAPQLRMVYFFEPIAASVARDVVPA